MVLSVASNALAPLALRVEVGAAGDVALLLHFLDDVLDQLLDLRRRVGVGGIAEQLLDGLRRQQTAREQRLEDRVVQILARHLLIGIGRARIVVEAARQQHVRELRDELLEIDPLEFIPGVAGVPVLHREAPRGDGVNVQLPTSNLQGTANAQPPTCLQDGELGIESSLEVGRWWLDVLSDPSQL
jgi:hypothetical protein